MTNADTSDIATLVVSPKNHIRCIKGLFALNAGKPIRDKKSWSFW